MAAKGNRIDELAEGWLSGSLTDDEVREFLVLLDRDDSAVPDLITEWLGDPAFAAAADAVREDRIFREILRKGRERPGDEQPVLRKIPLWIRRLRVAAVILLTIGGVWLLYRHPAPARNATDKTIARQKDFSPGGNKAVLTLGNGSRITLDSAANGALALQGGTQIIQLHGGRVLYTPQAGRQGPVVYNTLTTPRGGKYQLDLPDGTRVWLDAASSITYPVAFRGPDRTVEITGQAYLEVVHDPRHPFHVRVGGAEITDIGTSFNINAYADEPAERFTLLEGGIRVKINGRESMLRPGEQLALSNGTQNIYSDVDTAAVMAWKNGQFQLKGTDIQSLMRQIGRWYDVDIVFKGPAPDRHFGGSISRNVDLSTVLAALQQYGIPCRLNGRTITVGKP